MSTQSILRFIFILVFSFSLAAAHGVVWAQTSDTVAVDTVGGDQPKKKIQAGRQLCIGIDAVHPVLNSLVSDRFGYEFAIDYYTHNEMYLTAEGGWGGATVNYSDLKYGSTNNFLRFGFNKSILARDRPTDWDMMFIGFRAGVSDVHRTPATFTVMDSVWGNASGSAPGKNFFAYWAEITGGMRVEFVRGLFGGWNIRGKFMLNGRSFNDLAPLYIAGYGKGDKNVNFDFNVYISYGIRWKRRSNDPVTASEVKPDAVSDK